MTKNEIKITREELHNLVWSESLLSLSKKYEISDVGLRKICKRMNIPLPGHNYWPRYKAGQKIPMKNLPKVEEPVHLTTLRRFIRTTVYV